MIAKLFPKANPKTRENDKRATRKDLAILAPIVVLMGFLSPAPANSATAWDGLTVIQFGNDRWYNYDFLSESARSTNVDWRIGTRQLRKLRQVRRLGDHLAVSDRTPSATRRSPDVSAALRTVPELHAADEAGPGKPAHVHAAERRSPSTVPR